MDVGEPRRTIYVEPIELPEPLRPEAEPEREPATTEPVEEPIPNG